MTTITSPHNPRLKALKPPAHAARARAQRHASSPRARISCSPLPARRARSRSRAFGWRGSCARRRELPRGRARALRERLDARLGHARDRRLRAALERAARAAVRVPARRRRPRQRRHDRALGAGLRRIVRRARTGLRGPALAEGGAREHGRDLLRRAGARARSGRAARRAGRAAGRRARRSLRRTGGCELGGR